MLSRAKHKKERCLLIYSFTFKSALKCSQTTVRTNAVFINGQCRHHRAYLHKNSDMEPRTLQCFFRHLKLQESAAEARMTRDSSACITGLLTILVKSIANNDTNTLR